MPQKYTRPAVILHWLIALGIGFNLWFGLMLGQEMIPEDNIRMVINTHKSVGITVLGLVVMRVLWRLSHPAPAMPAGFKPWETKISGAVHLLLYAMMVAVPLFGWLHDSAWEGAARNPLVLFNTVPWFRLPGFGGMDAATKDWWHSLLGEAHEITGYVLLGAWALHVAGALKHQFVDKQKELQRMWF